MPPEPDDRVSKLEEGFHAILGALTTSDPLQLRKAELLEMRRAALSIATAMLGTDTTPIVRYGRPDPMFAEAIEIVAGYEGHSTFVRDLKRHLEVQGSLTLRQVEAVLAPPYENEIEDMKALGVESGDIRYRFQAKDAIYEARKRLRQSRSEAKAGTQE